MIYTLNLKNYIRHLVFEVIIPDTALDPKQ